MGDGSYLIAGLDEHFDSTVVPETEIDGYLQRFVYSS
jgi:hypothetical protein